MANAKKTPVCLFIVAVLFWTMLPGQAATTKKNKEPEPKVPIVVEADEIYFSDFTGDMFAKGNATLTQGNAKLLGSLIRGNAKQNEIWIDDSATFLQPSTKLVGTATHYNYKTRIGTMQKAVGKINRELLVGQNVELFPQEFIIHDGTMTGCPAKVPDYHVSATKVEIWPDDKLIAYNAKFWIKDKVIFSMAKYQKSLRKEDSKSEFPQMGYSSEDGFYIKQYLEVPLGGNIAVFGEPAYYTKAKFKPAFGLVDREDKYKITLQQGNYRDGNGYWVKKEPEFRLDYYSQRLGKLPISYNFYGIYGKWQDTTRTSWHQDYNLFFTRDPIKLNDTLYLYLGAGAEQIRESYDGSTINSLRFSALLGKTWSPRLYTWAAFGSTRNNTTLFAYGRTDLARELDAGFTYKIDRMNTIGFIQTYDLNNKRIFDQDITWYRNLHCWQAAITYRIKRSELNVDFTITRF